MNHKMKDTNTIIEEYRQGDFECRLFLFLQYRGLRQEFESIEEKEEGELRWLNKERRLPFN